MKRTAPYGQQRGRQIRRRTAPKQQRVRYTVPTQEKKFLDFQSNSGTILTLATTAQLTNASCNIIAQGSDESQRVGRKVVVKKIMLKGSFKIPGQTAIADASNRIRIIVYWDSQNNSNSAAVTGSTLLETDSINSFRNLSNSNRFKFLYDKTFDLNQMSGGGNGTADRLGEVQKSFDMYANCNIPIVYSGTSGVIGQQTENNIGVAVLCDTFTTTAPQILYSGRIRYTDA